MRAHARSTRWTIATLIGALMAAASLALGGAGPASADGAVALVSTEVADASEPSISADGRWIVFSGVIGERRSVFRHDRETDTTVELSPVPAAVRDGNTIHPRLSADGCVVVATTEIAFDLFRDDDRDARWDVYRLVVPECGGQPNGWELISLSRAGTAYDGVDTTSPAALSGSGAVIAFVHQAPRWPDGVGMISVVDVRVPLNEPGRVEEVARMPAEAPNRAYRYVGPRQPVLSENGRHLAFVSDTTSSDLLPGWADGPVEGGPATAQVFVWDRGADDQQRAVHLVSGQNGQPSAAGGASPAMSEDGRIVVFTSADRTLVPAQLPDCTPDCPTQVYRYDRDTDGNGIFDEAPRVSPLALVSAVDAGVVPVGLPVAGDRSSWAPAVNADGSQVAFVTDATNLLPSHRAGGGGPDDGDLLVAEFQLGELRRVLDRPGASGVPGAHGHPALSRTGEVIAFETAAASRLSEVAAATTGGVRNVVSVEKTPQLSLAALDFGTVLLGFESTELYAKVLNAGPAAFEPAVVESSSANFRVTGGTCKKGVIVAAGTSCSVHLTFNPTEPRGFEARLTVAGAGPGAPSVSATLRGAAGEPTLLVDPGGVDFDTAIVGGVGGRVAVDVANVGFAPTSIARIEVAGEHPSDFVIVAQSCSDRALNPDASCTAEIEFHPTGSGYRNALLVAATPQGQYTSAVLGGYARYAPTFRTATESARAGTVLGVGGEGFPAGAEVTIGFDDGSTPFVTITTTDAGTFLSEIQLPGRLRSGERRIVASSADGAAATATVQVLGAEHRSEPWLPGYGLP